MTFLNWTETLIVKKKKKFFTFVYLPLNKAGTSNSIPEYATHHNRMCNMCKQC